MMLVSIVTPTFNCIKYIDQTIQSIQRQSYGYVEHIVVDAVSTDGTVEKVKQYSNILLICEKDNGQSDALNKGFKKTTGDVLAWQNADDIYDEKTIEIVVDFFDRHPSVGLVYGNYQLIDENGKMICNVFPPHWNNWLFKHGRFVPLQPTVFWRRNLYEQIGELDTKLHYCMDVDFFARASKQFVFSKIDKFLGKFRVHKDSKTQNILNSAKVLSEYEQVLSRNFSYKYHNHLIFKMFQYRKKISSLMKRKFFKKI